MTTRNDTHGLPSTLCHPRKTSADEAILLMGALRDLGRANLDADLGVLAGRLSWGVGRVVRVMAHLERKGVADRARCRLTLAGLAMATAIEGAAHRRTNAA